MTTTYTWSVTALDCYPHADGQADVVSTIHWTCAGTDGTYNASVYSTCSVPPPSTDFSPFSTLTEEQVLQWVWDSGVDKEATEAAVQKQLANLQNPPIVQPPLPWSQA